MLLDKGGARIREAQNKSMDMFFERLDRPEREKVTRAREDEVADKATARVKTGPKVRVKVEETHDGEACECISKEMTVEIGQSIELEHVCHDGRVDIVRATVISVEG